ncbi:MAG: phosphate acetyltransferase [Gammaproteobacteria bacterium]|nr:phosphate acetyltransferase [Gammaproteobacteria bacterium]
MSRNLYVTINEAKSGKSAVSLGLMELLEGTLQRVGFFRPIARMHDDGPAVDPNIDLIRKHFRLEDDPESMYGVPTTTAEEYVARGRLDDLVEIILDRYKAYEENCDFVLIEGTNYEGVTSWFEFDTNAVIARNLGAPVLMIIKGKDRTVDEIVSSAVMSKEQFEYRGCEFQAAMVNMVDRDRLEEIRHDLQDRMSAEGIDLVGVIPEEEMLGRPTCSEIVTELGAEVVYGKKHLDNIAMTIAIAAMKLDNCLDRLPAGALVITPGDRQDIIAGLMAAQISTTMVNFAGIVLTGGFLPTPAIDRLIKGIRSVRMPILSVKTNTFETALAINSVKSVIRPGNHRKIDTILTLFARNVDSDKLREEIAVEAPEILTPKLFLHKIIHKAVQDKKRIVLPEGTEERILRATEVLERRDIVDVILLGDEEEIRSKADQLKLRLKDVQIINPVAQDNFDDYGKTYYQLRKHKKITLDGAHDTMTNPIFYGSMMVYKGDADGMVAGAKTATRDTLRPAFEFIKTKPGLSLISSVFFMCLEDRVLVYGDCAVNPNPTAEELAEIAISSAETAESFGIEPIVAMLSYATGGSGEGADVDHVIEATKIAQQRRPDLAIEGPIQYDAAIDIGVAKTKMPDSKVAGHATVFIFPDLNTGNNTYKAVQRSAHALAVGPILQGLNKPVNDLSRGSLVPDIINTVAITAIQAQNNAR